jgi:hypothetical protein
MLKLIRAGALALAALLCAPLAAHAACPTAPTYGGLTGQDASTTPQTMQTVTSGSRQLATPLVHGNDGSGTPKALALDGSCNLMTAPQAGPPGATNFTPAQVSVGTTATQIVASRSGRQLVTVVQSGTTDVYLGSANTVTTSNGLLLPGTKGASVTLPYAGAVYGIVASGTQTVTAAETY